MKLYAIITEEIKNKIVELYNSGLSIKKVAEKLDICFVTARKYLKLSGKKNRKSTRPTPFYSIDESFFEKIDSHKKAQVFGIIGSDGCLRRNGKFPKDSWMVEIMLQSRDEEYLVQLNNLVKNSKPIETKDYGIRNKPSYKIQIKNRQPISKFITCNYKFCKDLEKLGIHERKSLVYEFPSFDQVPDEFMNSFLLGYFEGDGSFCFMQDSFEASFQLICTNAFAYSMQKFILEKLDIHCPVVLDKRVPAMSVISVSGNKQVIKFMDWLYKDSDDSFRMKRKYDKYQNFKKIYFDKKEFAKTEEYRNTINNKIQETKKKFNRKNKDNFFYIKDSQNNIYFSNHLMNFYIKYHLTPCHASMLLNQKRQEYNGWTIPTEQEIQVAKQNNTIINEIFEPKRQERHKHLTNFYLKDYNGKIYFSETVDRVIKHYPQIERRFIVWTINHKVKRKNQSNFLYPTNQEIETAKQNNSIIILE